MTRVNTADAMAMETNDRALETELALQFRRADERPRNIDKIITTLAKLASLDPDTSEEMIYSLPSRDRNDPEKKIEGCSIRFAETLAQCWGNNRTFSRTVEIDRVNKQIIAEGVFHDLETNAITTMRHTRSIATNSGAIFGAEMIKTTANAAGSIAKRNAILAGIPKGIWRAAEREARTTITNSLRRLTPAQLTEKRREALGYWSKKGVGPDQIYRRLGVKSEAEIGVQDILDLRSMANAMRENLATKEELFEQGIALPAPNGEKKKRATLDDVANSEPANAVAQTTEEDNNEYGDF